ncbi:MAG TPA: ATP-binding protein, partial [Burkholderiales bacterium]|nr:ATP-binding protein [Burkholderiales bacterium]
LAEQTAASLEAADLILREAQQRGNARAVAATLPRLREELAHVPQIAAFVVLDAHGAVLARTNDAPAADPDFAASPIFTVHRDGQGPGVYLSDPFLGGPEAKSWRFALSRRLGPPGGPFAGVLVAVVEEESFERLYRAIEQDAGGFISLFTAEGTLITRAPDPGGLRGQRYHSDEIHGAVQREGRFAGWAASPMLQEPVLLAAAAVRGFPLFVASGSTGRAVFAPWHDQARLIALRTLLTSVAMLALIGLAAWGLARRERALERSEKRFRAMIERSGDAILLARPHAGGFVYASPAFERLTGFGLEDIMGRRARAVIHPDHLPLARRLRDETLRSPGKVAMQEMMVRHRDGSWRWVETIVTNLLHEPDVNAVVMNLRDITERKASEAERARLETRLRQAEKMEAVGRLAGGIAHDFNNILGGILGYAEMLAEGTAPGTAHRRYADNVLAAATRAAALVDQILSYSRSQRGKREPVQLERVLAETLELARGSIAAGIELRSELPPAPLFVVGDATQLHQIVMNLCTNAVHAMGERGTLRVALDSADADEPRAFRHTTLHPGRYARLTVQDSGAGMDEATLARLFEPFFTTKEVGKGTGLGLSLVYGIVTDAGGAIDVQSAPGHGSTFTIYLPRVNSPALDEEAEAGPIPRGRGERILVVDDEDALLAVTCEALKRLGYEPAGAPDGRSALAQFDAASEHFAAVVADEVMPGLTGTELAAALRQRRPDLPVVLVSGYIGPMMTERAHAAGVREILKKPLGSRSLATALARILGREALRV